jgi:hypothetical protein
MVKIPINKKRQAKLDFYPEENMELFEVFSEQAKSKLIPFAKTKAGSLICFWKSSDDADELNLPVVWIDSEALPNAVIATNVQDLYSILPYGTAFIKQALIVIKNYSSDAKLFISPDTFFKDWKNEQKISPGVLESIGGIDVAKNPLQILTNAAKKHAGFDSWFKKESNYT